MDKIGWLSFEPVFMILVRKNERLHNSTILVNPKSKDFFIDLDLFEMLQLDFWIESAYNITQ